MRIAVKPRHEAVASPPRAAYIHIPFCVSKCHYCDFNSYPGMESLFDDYVDALIREIRRAASVMPQDGLDTVYIGGGTPTVLPVPHLTSILRAIIDTIGLTDGAEITLEANPGTIDEDKLVQLKSANFNRISLGIQSFDDNFLSSIGRAHTALEAARAFGAARRAGFANISIDLIFAIPGQSISHWDNTIEMVVKLNPEHISLYELTTEEGTLFAKLCARGLVALVDEDTRVEMYELAIRNLTAAGFEHYEVSNFAKPGFRCRHNQVYWRNEPYYGFGAGATSYVTGERSRRICNPSGYVAAIRAGSDAVEFSEHLTGRAQLAETVIQGLRMPEGIDLSKFQAKSDTSLSDEFSDEIDVLLARGLIELTNDRLKVTHQGLLLMNDVAGEFVQATSGSAAS